MHVVVLSVVVLMCFFALLWLLLLLLVLRVDFDVDEASCDVVSVFVVDALSTALRRSFGIAILQSICFELMK